MSESDPELQVQLSRVLPSPITSSIMLSLLRPDRTQHPRPNKSTLLDRGKFTDWQCYAVPGPTGAAGPGLGGSSSNLVLSQIGPRSRSEQGRVTVRAAGASGRRLAGPPAGPPHARARAGCHASDCWNVTWLPECRTMARPSAAAATVTVASDARSRKRRSTI